MHVKILQTLLLTIPPLSSASAPQSSATPLPSGSSSSNLYASSGPDTLPDVSATSPTPLPASRGATNEQLLSQVRKQKRVVQHHQILTVV